MLFIVPTPIGNLQDMTLRSIDILKKVDKILCEDTRTSAVLLNHFEISKPLASYHMHNEHKKLDSIVAELKSGIDIALVSDSGTPGISDPGYLLVRECIKNNIDVECLPGPSALIPALILSGFPCDKFCFEGFLPHKKGKTKRVTELKDESRTIVFYESPHRLLKTLELLSEQFGGERPASVSREISKLHEETIRGTLHELIEMLEPTNVKGEIVIVVSGKNSK